MLHDPLHRFLCRGALEAVLLEPHPVLFAHLASTYAGKSGVRCLNAALAEADAAVTLYSPRGRDRDLEAYQKSSFSRRHVHCHMQLGTPPAIECRSGEWLRDTPLDAANRDEVTIASNPYIVFVHRHQGLCTAAHGDELDLETVRLVDMDHCPEIAAPEPGHGNVRRQNNSIELFELHCIEPGLLVTLASL